MTAPSNFLSPSEKNLLRLACCMAWSDGNFSEPEQDLLLTHLSELFGNTEAEQQALQQELQTYVAETVPLQALERLVANLQSEEDRELALKLSNMVIQAYQQHEPLIHPQEKVAYRRLVELLNLPEDTIAKVEWAAETELQQHESVIHAIGAGLRRFFAR